MDWILYDCRLLRAGWRDTTPSVRWVSDHSDRRGTVRNGGLSCMWWCGLESCWFNSKDSETVLVVFVVLIHVTKGVLVRVSHGGKYVPFSVDTMCYLWATGNTWGNCENLHWGTFQNGVFFCVCDHIRQLVLICMQ